MDIELRIILRTIHLLGFAIGFDGATVSDVMFFRAIKDKIVDANEYATLQVLSKVIWVGIFLLLASGFGIFYLIYQDNNGTLPLLASARWQMKLTLVGIVVANGLVFWRVVFSRIKTIGTETISNTTIWLLAITGTISMTSWYSILIVTAIPRGANIELIYLIGVYLLLIAGGIFTSRLILKKKLLS